MGCQNLVDLPHIDLHLKKVFYVMVDHLQQFNQGLCVIIGTIDCRHFVIDAVALIGHLQRGIGAKHVGVAPHRTVIPQLVEQLQKPAAVSGNGDILIEILPTLFLKPAFASQLSDQEPGPTRDVPQLFLVDILPLESCFRQLLLQLAAQHRIQRVFRNFQSLLIRFVKHIKSV